MIFILLGLYIINIYYLKKKRLFRSSFAMHFFFISLIFIGPALYYEIGLTSYSNSFEPEDVITFEKYGIFVFSVSLVFMFLLANIKKSFLDDFFKTYRGQNKNVIFVYFLFWYVLVGVYILFYIAELPVVKFISTGSLPERFDQSDNVRLFYTFSSIFMVFIPSGYFFFIRYLKTPILKLLLLLLVVFILSSGGHKGLAAYFIIFALLFSGFRFNLKYILILGFSGLGLLVVYTLTKGKEFNEETFIYLLESPPRRFFVTQGSAFITRISMDRRYKYMGDIYEYRVIKSETYQEIYPGLNEKGAAPTIFLGDIHVRYGPIFTGISYILFLIFCFPIIKAIDGMSERRLYIWWSLFILFYVLGTAELSYYSSIRVFLVFLNIFLLVAIANIKLKTPSS
ncbi:hypothetical protein [Allomuricauda sp. SCSIO 65647]|uniref:hypothetical protein n=1 Tax=Allomuricauda sp. SCSIO 65647 TaxID=2908843 RepID=UPI001F3B0DF3|nr:hypothetical protein [Muricauda sp. SCSIO 65647]UJH69040.1 hypothetical protein L0P89_07440 [Muricauda sp. SCSIO 65647]